MVQAWPLAWLMRIGSIKKLPMWTFLQTLTCWFFTRGKATTSLQYERGMRHYSHHSKIKSYLEVHAARYLPPPLPIQFAAYFLPRRPPLLRCAPAE